MPQLFKLNDQDFLIKVRGLLAESDKHTREWRQEAKELYNLYAGKQWSDEDRSKLESEQRACLTFNRIGVMIDAVAGAEVQNRQEVRYIPREIGDAGPNELVTGAAEYIRDECDAEFEESEMFGTDACLIGMGWTNTSISYDLDPEGQVCIDRIDPLSMGWDPSARRRNIADAEWIYRIHIMSRDEVESRWPDKINEIIERAEGSVDEVVDEAEIADRDLDDYPSSENVELVNKGFDKQRRRFGVVEFQWLERRPVIRTVDPSNDQIVELEPAEFEKVRPILDTLEIPGVRQTRIKFYRAWFSGQVMLDRHELATDEGFTYQPVTGKRDRNTNTWFGLGRAMSDPQKFSNKFMSSLLDFWTSNAKGGVLAERGAFQDFSKAESDWAKSNSIVETTDGAVAQGKIVPKPMPDFPAVLVQLMGETQQALRDVSGINLELLGLADRQQAGILEFQRKQAAITTLAILFDSLRLYRKRQGRVLLDYIQKFLSDGRLVRINGDLGPQYAQLVKSEQFQKYDVIVDEAATSTNMKERVFQILSSLMPSIASMGIPIPPDILDYAPLPEVLASKWKRFIAEQAQQAEDPRAEAEAQESTAKAQELMTQSQKNLADAKKAEAEARQILAKLGLSAEEMRAKIAQEDAKIGSQLDLDAAKGFGELAKGRAALIAARNRGSSS